MYLVKSQLIFLLFKFLLHLLGQVAIIVDFWFVEVGRQTLCYFVEHFLEPSSYLHVEFVGHFVSRRKFWVKYIILEFVGKNMSSLEYFKILINLILVVGVSGGRTNLFELCQRFLTFVWIIHRFFQDL